MFTEITDKNFIIDGTVIRKYIGDEKKVTIPNGIKKILRNAFLNSKIEELDIPGCVANIEDGAFLGCTRLKKINVDSQYFCITENCLYDLRKNKIIFALGSVNLAKIDGLKSIGEFTFSNTKLEKSFVIPEGVTQIGNCAFWGCSGVEEVIIPSTVKAFDLFYSFNCCDDLKNIVLTEGVQKLVYNTGLPSIKNLKTIDVPDSVTEIVLLKNDIFLSKHMYVMLVNEGSYAHKFAIENNLKFKLK